MSLPAELTISEQDKLKKLFDLGYFAGSQWDSIKRFTLGTAEVKEAVEQYRDFHGLPPGDTVDEKTTTDLFMPRCGVPDFVQVEGAAIARWSFTDVTCAHRIEGLQPLGAEDEKRIYLESLASINGVCGLNLKLIESMSQANVYSEVGNTQSGVLAYSYMPGGDEPLSTRLQQVYGRNVNWSKSLLKQVCMHEIGHAMGLPHAPSSTGAIMSPTASGKTTVWQSWDIEEFQRRYGKPKPKPPEEPPVPPSGQRIVIPSDLEAGSYRLVRDAIGDEWNFSPQ